MPAAAAVVCCLPQVLVQVQPVGWWCLQVGWFFADLQFQGMPDCGPCLLCFSSSIPLPELGLCPLDLPAGFTYE